MLFLCQYKNNQIVQFYLNQKILNYNLTIKTIVMLREKEEPEKSLITIELTPKTHKIRQKCLAYNCPIRNKAQTEFIERWHKHVLECV